MAAMGPDHGQLVPIRLVGGPADGRRLMYPHQPGTPLPEVIHYGPRAAGEAYRRAPEHEDEGEGVSYVWSSLPESPTGDSH